MAGLRGNIGWIMAQRQTVKGTPATYTAASAYKNALSGGSIGPTRNTDNLSETDSSRDRGVTYVQSAAVEGSPEFYVRDASAGFWLNAALGADAVTGTTNFVHAITGANSIPYLTVWRDIGDTLYEQFQDVKVGTLTMGAEAGAPLTCTAALQGTKATRLTVAPDNATPKAVESSQVYNYNNATVTLSSGATQSIRSFELTIENNLTQQQTDDVFMYDIYEGTREVSLTFDMIFENLAEYNSFHYGSSSGTVQSPSIYTTSAVFDFNLGANNDIAFNLPSIAYTDFPVEGSAAGDPVVVSVAAAAQRGGSPVVTATVKNQVATY